VEDDWKGCNAEMQAFFDQCSDCALEHVLYEVYESIDHTDPVLLYIDDSTLTNFGKFDNLQERKAPICRPASIAASAICRRRSGRVKRKYSCSASIGCALRAMPEPFDL
jgi:hypothetical protein